MNTEDFSRYLRDGGHSEKSIQSRLSKLKSVETEVGQDAERLVSSDQTMVAALTKLKPHDHHGVKANALRKYYEYKNGRQFGILSFVNGTSATASSSGASIDLDKLSVEELLKFYGTIMGQLKERKVLRTNNLPQGDYAEWLVCKQFGLDMADPSTKGYDAKDDASGLLYQIKGLWEPTGKKSTRQLSPLRDLNGFDYLVALIFDASFEVKAAYQIPVATVRNFCRLNNYQASKTLCLSKKLLADPTVIDITDRF